MFVVLYMSVLINYLEYCTVLYKVDRYIDDQNSSFVECRLLVNANEHERQLQYHYKRRMNIVISDMDTINTCDRPLVKFLWNFCCEWNCSSQLFRKFQVNFSIKYYSIQNILIFF